MRGAISNLRLWGVRILCALALLVVGIPGQPILSAPFTLTSSDLTQYRLPDGTFPVFCITYKDTEGKQRGATFSPTFEIGQLAAAVIPPAPQTEVFERVSFQSPVLNFSEAPTFRRAAHPPNSGPRAPPSSDISA